MFVLPPWIHTEGMNEAQQTSPNPSSHRAKGNHLLQRFFIPLLTLAALPRGWGPFEPPAPSRVSAVPNSAPDPAVPQGEGASLSHPPRGIRTPALSPSPDSFPKDIGKRGCRLLQLKGKQLGGGNFDFGRVNVRLEMAESATFCRKIMSNRVWQEEIRVFTLL